MPRSLGVAEKLILSAWRLRETDKSVFTAEDLVVAAWKASPETFGLRGFLDESGTPIYPDSNRVFAEIMGSKPLRKRGLIERVGNKQYRLTAAGERRALDLLRAGSDASPRKAGLDRATGTDLQRYLDSRAMTKWREGRSGEITFHDACSFWGISARSKANDLRARLAHFRAVIEETEAASAGDPFIFRHSERPISPEAVAALTDLSCFLEKEFDSDLAVINQRTDR